MHLWKKCALIKKVHLRFRYSDQKGPDINGLNKGFLNNHSSYTFLLWDFTLSVWSCRPIMVINANLISATGWHIVSKIWRRISTDKGQAWTIKPDMQNQHNILEGLSRGVWETTYWSNLQQKNITFITYFAGSQLTSQAFCTLHKPPTKKNSPIGTRQGTGIAKKHLS